MHGNGRVRQTDLNWHAMVLHQQFDLLNQIIAKQVGPGDRCGIAAGPRNMTKRQAAVGFGMAHNGQTDFGVIGTHADCLFSRKHGGAEMFGQKLCGLGIKVFQQRHCGGGICKSLWHRVWRGQKRDRVVIHGIIFSKYDRASKAEGMGFASDVLMTLGFGWNWRGKTALQGWGCAAILRR